MKKLIRSIKKSSIKSKLFISFLILTLLMSTLISMCAYFISFGIIKERVSSSFSLTLDYVSGSVNAELKQIHSLADYLFVNNVIKQSMQKGTQNTAEALLLNNQANDTIKQYAISHIFENINSITLFGYNGYYLNYALSYTDIAPDYTQINNEDWNNLIKTSNGKNIWIGLTSRLLNPNRSDSATIHDILLLRSIKSANYSEDIGMMCISVNPRAFTKLVQTYDINYPDFAGNCGIYILDNHNNIINMGDDSPDEAQILEILNAEDSYQPEGHLVRSQNKIAFVRSASVEGWKVIGTIPLSSVMVDNTYIFYISVITFVLSIIVCSLIWLYLSSGIFKPLRSLAETMEKIENGNTSLRAEVSTVGEVGALGLKFNSMLERIESLHSKNIEKERKVKDAEYRALQAQINPHFLYNTLISIRWMAILINADNIKNALDAFWKITKFSTDNNERFVTVEAEINIVKQYIYLQKIAYRNKFDVVWNVDDDTLPCRCIKFFLQPFVENSIMHGIFPEKCTGTIYISIFKEDDFLVFNVYDDGSGMSPETIEFVIHPNDDGSYKKNVGLPNVIERLEYAYGEKYNIDISSEEGHFTNIMIKVPLIQ